MAPVQRLSLLATFGLRNRALALDVRVLARLSGEIAQAASRKTAPIITGLAFELVPKLLHLLQNYLRQNLPVKSSNWWAGGGRSPGL